MEYIFRAWGGHWDWLLSGHMRVGVLGKGLSSRSRFVWDEMRSRQKTHNPSKEHKLCQKNDQAYLNQLKYLISQKGNKHTPNCLP